jgi:hypothetical protein
MKRFLLMGWGVAIFMAMAGSAEATTSQTFGIVVSVAGSPVDLQSEGSSNLSFGIVAAGSNTTSNHEQGNPRCTVTNVGYATLDYTVVASIANSAGASGSTWALGTTLGGAGGPAANTAVLAAIFTAAVTTGDSPFPAGRDLFPADFGDEDVVNGNTKTADANVLARNNTLPAPEDAESVKGYNVSPASATRSLRFLFEAPTSVDAQHQVQQNISIIISAANVH